MILDENDDGRSAASSAAHGDRTALQAPLAEIEADLAGLMRALAESRFELQGRAQAQQEQTRELLLELLDIADAFERVFASVDAKADQITPQMSKWLANFRTVWRLLQTTLRQRGVEPMDELQAGFDPHRHRVAETVTDPALPEGSVVSVPRRGYLWHGVLLRKAELVVVRGSAEPPAEGAEG